MKYIRLVADTNDADYVETFEPISDENIAKLGPIVQAIKSFKPYRGNEYTPGHYHSHDYNWTTGDSVREDLGGKPVKEVYSHLDPDLIDWFSETYIPSSEYGIHTIESIEILEVSNIERLL